MPPANLPGLKLPTMPADIRPTKVAIPRGPLDAKKTMHLVADIRRSELRNARTVARARAYYDAVRRAYGKTGTR